MGTALLILFLTWKEPKAPRHEAPQAAKAIGKPVAIGEITDELDETVGSIDRDSLTSAQYENQMGAAIKAFNKKRKGVVVTYTISDIELWGDHARIEMSCDDAEMPSSIRTLSGDKRLFGSLIDANKGDQFTIAGTIQCTTDLMPGGALQVGHTGKVALYVVSYKVKKVEKKPDK